MDTSVRIIAGVDGSEGGARALRWAIEEAAARGGIVDAVTAFTYDGLDGTTIPYQQARREAVERALVEAVSAAHRDAPGVPVTTKVINGYAPDALTDAAADADLLVLGSHGHGRLFHAVLGSVAEHCVRHATCPVVVVPVPARPAEPVAATTREPATGLPAGIL